MIDDPSKSKSASTAQKTQTLAIIPIAKSLPVSTVGGLLGIDFKNLLHEKSEPPRDLGLKMGRALRPLQTASVVISTPVNLGSFIKSSRIAKKLTQQQLADLAGVGRRFIVECEAGKPRLEFAKVLQVAAAAGIDIIAIKR
jgi:y4mF family transcriptional regulator